MKRAVLGLILLASVSCGDLTRQGTGSSYLTIEALEAASGGELASDLRTIVNGVPTVLADSARVTFALRMKDPGPAGSATSPSAANAITINRYRVRFIRSDGRNIPGVDVPYAFDGAFTVTVSDTATVEFTLVRVQAKEEPPLAGLAASSAGVLSTIAEVTFYGHDQTGREVSVTGNIGVNFANWGDPS